MLANVHSDNALQLDLDEPASQKELCKAIDDRTFASMCDASVGTPSRRAHLSLLTAKGAGAFWHATPSRSMHLDMEPCLYRVVLQRWLRMPFADEDSYCPLCENILDRYGDHCLSCSCGGERTRRHNLLRNQIYYACSAANLRPELERPGLLPPRPFDEPGTDCSNREASARRPADVYLPRWAGGPPAALDFAVTSGLNQDVIAGSAQDRETACRQYEDRKRSHMNTAAVCQQQGFTFVPMIVEAVGGGWGAEARRVFSEIAKVSAFAAGDLTTDSDCGAALNQRLSMTLHRENARAVLRRFAHTQSLPAQERLDILATVGEDLAGR